MNTFPRQSFLLLGGSDQKNGDYSALRKLAGNGGSCSGWSCPKSTRRGDELWMYITSPISGIVAKAVAMCDAIPGQTWQYECSVGNVEWIQQAITRDELLTLLPDWSWPRAARGKTILTDACATLLRSRLTSSSLEKPTHVVFLEPQEEVDAPYWTINRALSNRWICASRVERGDRVLIYSWAPISAIVATATAARAARRYKSGRFETTLQHVRWLKKPILLRELREAFPSWRWTKNCASRVTLPKNVAALLWDLAYTDSGDEALEDEERLNGDEVQNNPNGGGFGDWKSNRIVEAAAVRHVKAELTKLGYHVESREREKIGYDLDAVGQNETMHVEVKGTAGSDLAYIISKKEIECAKQDSVFRLFVVTNATSTPHRIHTFTSLEMFETFDLAALSYRATVKKTFRND